MQWRKGRVSNKENDGKGTANLQNNLITQVAALHKPMVVVLEGGSVIDVTPWLSTVPAVVMAWYPGMVGGRALGKLLFGNDGAGHNFNFSGKLPISWPTSLNDEPTFSDGSGSTTMDYYLGYRRFDQMHITPQFAFGYGLSYSGAMSYSNIQVPCTTVPKDGVVKVTVDVANPSTVAKDEVVFLFVSFPSTTARRSVKELKGFFRVSLDANQTKRITIPVRVSDLDYFDMASNKWVIENGPVKIMVGPNAGNLMLQDTVTVKQ